MYIYGYLIALFWGLAQLVFLVVFPFTTYYGNLARIEERVDMVYLSLSGQGLEYGNPSVRRGWRFFWLLLSVLLIDVLLLPLLSWVTVAWKGMSLLYSRWKDQGVPAEI